MPSSTTATDAWSRTHEDLRPCPGVAHQPDAFLQQDHDAEEC
ncbi:hypothetical protein ACIRG5_24730 [Lentzea sp. NPDC102401]